MSNNTFFHSLTLFLSHYAIYNITLRVIARSLFKKSDYKKQFKIIWLITYFKLSTKKYRLYNYLILLNHKDSFVTFFYRTISYSIYHNIRYQHRLRGPQSVSDGKPVKQATNHPKTRQKRTGSVFTACMSMRTSA
ncbi:hypothetical protein E2C00_35450 [Streptomyces sp. WAC05374]|nr:hypothetical protein E2C00_35450 [Streptomyces sp. WAC05374]